MKYPFKEIQNDDNVFIRTFDESIDEMELIWHMDREDRIVSPIGETNWMLQMENSIPKRIEGELFIPKETYHRVIKGDKDLKIKVIKL